MKLGLAELKSFVVLLPYFAVRSELIIVGYELVKPFAIDHADVAHEEGRFGLNNVVVDHVPWSRSIHVGKIEIDY